MKLNQLRALLAVADQGTVLRAAEVLSLTQSAVSKAVKELEAELGVPLLQRTASGMSLTKYGELVARRGRLINSEVGRIREDVRVLDGVHRGHLSIGLTPVSAQANVGQALVKLWRRYPMAAFTIHEERSHRLYAMVREGLLDLAVSSDVPPAGSGCQWTPLTTVPSMVCVRKGHPHQDAMSITDLMSCEWLTMDETDDESSSLVRFFDSQGLPLPARITRCASMSVFAELAFATDAVSLWAATALRHEVWRSHVVRLRLQQEPLPRELGIVCLDFELLTRLAQEAVQLLSITMTEWDFTSLLE